MPAASLTVEHTQMADLTRRAREDRDVAVGVAPLSVRDPAPGAELGRPMLGCPVDRVPGIVGDLVSTGADSLRLVCQLTTGATPEELVRLERACDDAKRLRGLDVVLWVDGEDPAAEVFSVGAALLLARTRPWVRVFLDPIDAYDRSMEVTSGLLDRRGNPTVMFGGVRALASIFATLDERLEPFSPAGGDASSLLVRGLDAGEHGCRIVRLPEGRELGRLRPADVDLGGDHWPQDTRATGADGSLVVRPDPRAALEAGEETFVAIWW